jgi:hypothetical protein
MTRLSLKNYKKTQTQFALVDIHASGASGSAASVPLPYSCTSQDPSLGTVPGPKKKRERGKASMVITKPAVFQPFTQAEPVEADGHPEIHILIGPRGANVEQGKESHGQATAGNHNLTSPFPSARVAGFASLGRQLQSHPSPRSVGGGHRPVCC